MGGGSWSPRSYASNASAKKAAGKTTFDYSDTTRRAPVSSWKCHESLDPKLVAGEKSPHAGQVMRECMISEEHPNPTPIAVFFDVTGSMHRIPQVLQQKLPALHGLLQRKGYVEDPQILFGAVGDAFSDRVPLQVGQFESDNTMDENLENIFLEGGGGGGNHESYQLAAYFLSEHTYLESFEKQGRKGYAFFIGDERIYKAVDRGQVERIIGDTLEDNLTTEQVFEKLQEKYHVFFLFAEEGSYVAENVLPEDAANTSSGWSSNDGLAMGWRPLLGQNAIVLEDASAVCETIALTLGVMEGTVSYEDGLEDLAEIADASAVEAAGKALATVGANSSAVAEATSELPDTGTDTGGASRV